MAATEVDLAESVVAELNDAARVWTGQFTAARSWLPIWTDAQLATLRVAVVPMTIERRALSRAKDLFDYGIAIDFQRLIDDPTSTAGKATIDGLCLIAEQVHDFYRLAHRLENTMTEWWAGDAVREDVYDIELLNHHNIWETLIVITLRNQR